LRLSRPICSIGATRKTHPLCLKNFSRACAALSFKEKVIPSSEFVGDEITPLRILAGELNSEIEALWIVH
jgi:hypothetical protein